MFQWLFYSEQSKCFQLVSFFCRVPFSRDMGRDCQSLCLPASEDLPPFKCFAKHRTGYKSSAYGPKFGNIEVAYRYSIKRVEARAFLYKPYSVPAEVKNKYNVLVGTAKPFSPDNYEVFFLAWKSILEKKNKQL